MYFLYRYECVAVKKSYSKERKYHCRVLLDITKWKLCMEVILNNFEKTSNSFYFQNTLTLWHLVLIKRFPNMSHFDTKIQRLLISFLLSKQFQIFTKSPPISPLGKKIYKIKIISRCVTQFLCPVMVPLLKYFFWYYSHPNTLPFSDSATHSFYPRLKFCAVCLSGKL